MARRSSVRGEIRWTPEHPEFIVIPNIIKLKSDIWHSPRMRVKTGRMRASFASRSYRGLTRMRVDRRFRRMTVIRIESEVTYLKFQNEGGTTPTGGAVSPARFIEDGMNTWINQDGAYEIRWR